MRLCAWVAGVSRTKQKTNVVVNSSELRMTHFLLQYPWKQLESVNGPTVPAVCAAWLEKSQATWSPVSLISRGWSRGDPKVAEDVVRVVEV